MLTNPSCSNSSLSLCFDYGDTMPITGYDVSKSGCCPSSEEGFAAKTGYAESELRDARAPDQAPLKAMDDYHLLFSLRPSEQLFLNQLHLIWEGGPISVLKVKVVPEKG